MYCWMLSLVGTTVALALFSRAQSCLAPSIWRRLLMQAFCCAVVRACTKLGIAIAASKPMMATTIMISINVKPALREELIFILLCFVLFYCGVNQARAGLIYCVQSFTNCPLPTA